MIHVCECVNVDVEKSHVSEFQFPFSIQVPFSMVPLSSFSFFFFFFLVQITYIFDFKAVNDLIAAATSEEYAEENARTLSAQSIRPGDALRSIFRLT